ncbi:MAG: hypothetical protein JNL38_36790 [Myxococcales bacterium]|nr:hypothetical protein [Myxococcales bacterium]
MRPAVGLAVGIALVGCGGTVADLGDGPTASEASPAVCVGFVDRVDVCALPLAPRPSAGLSELAQGTSELWALSRRTALEVAWACDALASWNPTTPVRDGAPPPTAGELQAKCQTARARVASLAPRVIVAFSGHPGRCQSQLCPAQGMRQCTRGDWVASVSARDGELSLVDRTVLQAVLPVLYGALHAPLVDASSAVARGMPAIDSAYPTCADELRAGVAAASALASASAEAGGLVLGAFAP